ncbi:MULTISPECIES: SIR2 family NAD-dependent protein deacylase [unclassified Pseudomonas]|nr:MULTISPECIES: SIR2 family protein [unclassified Pseudomonas]WNF56494.1 SIR2 family protein [Pseudomonas sp. SG20052]
MSSDEIDIIQKAMGLPDYALIKKLAAALWQQNPSNHGAAIMIGAGFTRCAAESGDTSKSPPLWLDLSRKLAQELDPSNPDLPYSDPLRLAEEYRAHFGQQTMIDLLRSSINDSAWRPGKFYNTLLDFPWTEILTTNWDTLLERAAVNVHHRVYNTVTKQADLSYVRPPRIVKLHGTIDITEELIFTQEDYRKYPQTHAAYVNFARQIFIENELCLIGFSGDDPNFLQWAGWVRDNLTAHARKIYLIGALRLTPGKRKYLESLNVAPIDLESLVDGYDDPNLKHIKATEIFFEILNLLKPDEPSDWSPKRIESSTPIEQYISTLESDRNSYPGWLVCPPSLRWELQTQISISTFNPNSLTLISASNRAKLLYEKAWRHSLTYEIVPQWLANELLKICNPETSDTLNKKQQLEIALLLLQNTRWHEYDTVNSLSVSDITTLILEENSKHWPDVINEIAYHKALIARDNLNYIELELFTRKISEQESIWKIRKASLLSELGLSDEGETLVSMAYNELRNQYRKDSTSLYILSRLSWAHFVMHGINLGNFGKPIDPLPSNYKKWKCDPRDHIEHIERRVHKELESHYKQQIEPLFTPGHYREKSDSINLSNELHILLLVDGTSRNAGLPITWKDVNFIKSIIENITTLNILANRERFSLTLRISSYEKSKAITNAFSRMKLACAKQEDIDNAINYCTNAVAYWQNKLATATLENKVQHIQRLRVFIEVLGRLLIRATPEISKKAFQLAISMGHEKYASAIWLHSPISNLLNNALASIPESQHHELLLDALNFPLPHTKGNPEWPNPVIYKPGVRSHNHSLNHRISEIIRTISTDSLAPRQGITNPLPDIPSEIISGINNIIKLPSISTPSLSRLLPLLINNFTSDSENDELSIAIFGKDFNYSALPNSDFFPHVFKYFPTSDTTRLNLLISNTLFAKPCNTNPTHLSAIIAASTDTSAQILPTHQQAIDYFDVMTLWRLPTDANSPLNIFESKSADIADLIGQALAYSIVPSLLPQDLTLERFETLKEYFSHTLASSLALALVHFHGVSEEIDVEIHRVIRRSLQEKQPNKVRFAALAALKLRELTDSDNAKNLISRVVYLVESGRKTSLAHLLWVIRESYRKNLLDNDELGTIRDSLPIIFEESNYHTIDHDSRDAVDASLIRAECVKLAHIILESSNNTYSDLKTMIEAATTDPLPEVRFATFSM